MPSILAFFSQANMHRRRKQFHFGGAERNTHCDAAICAARININKVSRVKYCGGPAPPPPRPPWFPCPWHGLLNFDQAAGSCYHWTIIYSVQVLRLRTNWRVQDVKYLPATKVIYSHTRLQNSQASYLNMKVKYCSFSDYTNVSYLRLAALKPCTKTKVCTPFTSYIY